MGGSKQKTTSTSEVKVPEWVSQGGQQTYNAAKSWIDSNPVVPYTGQRAATATPNQQAASKMAMDTANAGQRDLSNTRQLIRKVGQADWSPIFAPQIDQPDQVTASINPIRSMTQPGDVSASQIGVQDWGTDQATKYMSPFASLVRDNTLREIDRANEQERDQVDDQAQAAKAFGGLRHAILESDTRKNQATARSDYVDQANEAAYNDAYGKFTGDRSAKFAADQSNQDADLRAKLANQSTGLATGQSNLSAALAADQSNQEAKLRADLSNQDYNYRTADANAGRTFEASQFNENNRNSWLDRALQAGSLSNQTADLAGNLASRGTESLLTTGLVDQDVNQRALDAAYEDWLRTQDAPLDRYTQLAGILSGVPINRTENGTQVTKKSGGLGSSLLGIAQIGASIYSDRRLKTNIVKIGELAKGISIYAFNYIWPSVRHVGVMADEVIKVVPEAVELMGNGFYRVNYGKLA